MKTLKSPVTEDFKASLNEAQEWTESAGYKEDDVTAKKFCTKYL